MKKIICCILVFTITLCSFHVPVFAKDWLYASDSMIDAYNKAQQFKEQAVEGIDWYNGMVGNFGSGLGHLIGGSFSIVKNAVLSPIDGFIEGWNTDWKDVVDKGINDGEIRADDDYIYIHQNVINNINQKVQSRVHALDGYYLFDSVGKLDYDNLNNICKHFINGFDKLDNASETKRNNVIQFLSQDGVFLLSASESVVHLFYLPIFNSNEYFYFCDSSNRISCYDVLNGSILSTSSASRYSFSYRSITFYDSCPIDFSLNYVCYGSLLKVFYDSSSGINFLSQGQQHYSASLPKGLYRIPINVVKNYNTTNSPNITYNNNVTNMDAPDIENSLNITLKGYLDKLFSGEFNSNNPTPTPGSSGGSSGGDHGGTGGDFGNPTPTPDPDGGFTSGTYDLLDQIYKWLVSFGEKHDIFAKKITDYIEANDGKLDQIIEAINALADGKTETENNGCKYDFTALSDFMTKLWNDSDQKFDTMVSLLEENNKYQQKLVNSLNEIKAILVTQTVLELFQDRSSETANKAKDKFPTSLPWDIAMVVNAMAAEPQEIKIDLPIEIQSLGIHEEINIDLSSGEWEKLAKTCRYLLSILFILFMIHLSRKMFFNGGDD
ncbi:Uncharacterised protein [[Ruminococcus] torques]|nr:Uncharacterised protein [[Ruminococcus] torques]SCJ15814.1 Uncharacterised protein [uncultured Ruminococcus sp.]